MTNIKKTTNQHDITHFIASFHALESYCQARITADSLKLQ